MCIVRPTRRFASIAAGSFNHSIAPPPPYHRCTIVAPSLHHRSPGSVVTLLASHSSHFADTLVLGQLPECIHACLWYTCMLSCPPSAAVCFVCFQAYDAPTLPALPNCRRLLLQQYRNHVHFCWPGPVADRAGEQRRAVYTIGSGIRTGRVYDDFIQHIIQPFMRAVSKKMNNEIAIKHLYSAILYEICNIRRPGDVWLEFGVSFDGLKELTNLLQTYKTYFCISEHPTTIS